jgi:two-component system sensor histidine kinase KdpD
MVPMSTGGRRGLLRLYLGAAPGVGKTYAMLDEGHRRASRGTDVVIGVVEPHGRAPVAALVDGLPTVPGRAGRSGQQELDVEALLERRPEVVLVDGLAHTNAAPSSRAKRWEEVEELLEAGISVISTLNIEHLESLNDVVASITGVTQTETVPDEVVRRADQIQLVDMTPEALRRRMAHGNIYPAERVDAALSRYFRVGNLAALRELALLWLADRVDEELERYRRDHDIDATWATRERVLVALTGGPESEVLLRRGARIAGRGAGGELHAVSVAGGDRTAPVDELGRLRLLTEELGGRFHAVVADDPAEAVMQLARSLNASQVVLGVSRRSRWRSLARPGVSERVTAAAGDVDVLVVTHPYARRGTSPALDRPLGTSRVRAGWALAVTGPPLLALALLPTQGPETLALEAMAFLALTVASALVGGLRPALTAAVAGALLLNWFFTPPRHTLTVADPVDVLTLAVFLVVAAAVAGVVDTAARRSIQAELAGREAATLLALDRTLLGTDHDVEPLLELVNETFGVDSSALLRRTPEGLVPLATAGREPPRRPGDAGASADVSETLVLVLGGAPLPAHERGILAAFTAHLAAVLDRRALADRAAGAHRLEEGNRVRTALLAAVSHDLRTPLAGIKAAVSSLRSVEVRWSAADQQELLATIEDSTDRLGSILANLLDLSRLQADAVRPILDEIGLEDVVSRAVCELPPGAPVVLRLSEQVAPVVTDPGLLDRVVANLASNAVRHSPPGRPVTLSTSQVGARVQLHVVDHGPGVPDEQKERMFDAFQRLGDQQGREGLGLGLAVARGLTETLGGVLIAEDTPGGGLTMVLDLPAAPVADTVPRPVGARQDDRDIDPAR